MIIGKWTDSSPLFPGNHDLRRLRPRRPRRQRRRTTPLVVRYLPGYRPRVVPDPEPLLGLTAASEPLPRELFGRCVARTYEHERLAHGHRVVASIRGGKWV